MATVYHKHGTTYVDQTGITSATTITFDCSFDSKFVVSPVGHNITIDFSNFDYEDQIVLLLVCDATPRTITYGTSIGASTSSLVLTASKTQILTFYPYNSLMYLKQVSAAI